MGLCAVSVAASTAMVTVGLGAPAATARGVPTANAAASPGQDLAGRSGLVANLRGSKEVPGPGDRNGRGRAVIKTNRAKAKVCVTAEWSRIGTPTAAHIHRGGRTVSGDVVIDFTGAVTGGRNCARDVSKRLIRNINQHPRRFYFNIHNERYPAGAIRGQLHR